MKKYTTPELKALAFAAIEAISADDDSSRINNGEFGGWGVVNG